MKRRAVLFVGLIVNVGLVIFHAAFFVRNVPGPLASSDVAGILFLYLGGPLSAICTIAALLKQPGANHAIDDRHAPHESDVDDSSEDRLK